jgi:hypothetical protein
MWQYPAGPQGIRVQDCHYREGWSGCPHRRQLHVRWGRHQRFPSSAPMIRMPNGQPPVRPLFHLRAHLRERPRVDAHRHHESRYRTHGHPLPRPVVESQLSLSDLHGGQNCRHLRCLSTTSLITTAEAIGGCGILVARSRQHHDDDVVGCDLTGGDIGQ